MSDTFRTIIPATFEKSEDGKWKVAGLASTESMDQQGEIIMQKGIDLTPIDKKKGLLNFDHQKGPENTIGLLDGYRRDGKGLYIEGRLFKNHTKARAVYEIMSSLGKSDRGRVGLSVEGRILKRNDQNPRIIEKCQINAVAVTLNPVNQETYADLTKSLSAAEVEFDSTGEKQVGGSEEAVFTPSQVVAIVQKALGVGDGYTQAPESRSGGDTLAMEDMGDKKKKKKELDKGGPGSGPKPKSELDKEDEKQGVMISTPRRMQRRRLKKMSKSLFKSNMVEILDKLQILYPDNSRSEIWEAFKERLETRYAIEKAKMLRLKQTDPKEKEHKLYEDARQRDDYEENKDKTRQQLSEIARDSGAPAKERAKIRAQADAAKQVGDRDHVRPGVGR